MSEFGPLSNTFLRLAKKYGDRDRYVIFDFHKSPRGMWVQRHDNVKLNGLGERVGDCAHHPIRNIYHANYGNDVYAYYKKHGYKYVGKFEQDIFGNERRVV